MNLDVQATVRRSALIRLYRSDVGKKYVMAVTGIILMSFVLLHMIGNLKLYLGMDSLNHYSEWLRRAGEPVLPGRVLLWIARVGLIISVVLHIDAAARLARKSRQARPVAYAAHRKYAEADFASRTIRWTGPIVLLFVIFHLLDLTWGTANPDFRNADPYHNIIESFQRIPIGIVYVIANLALAFHLYHGAWSLFQTLGIGGHGTRISTRHFAVAFAVVVALGNISFPIMVMTGAVG